MDEQDWQENDMINTFIKYLYQYTSFYSFILITCKSTRALVNGTSVNYKRALSSRVIIITIKVSSV